MTRPDPTILERLVMAGLKPEVAATLADAHKKRRPCACSICTAAELLVPEPAEPGQLAAFEEVDR